jgi:hypothetical protein
VAATVNAQSDGAYNLTDPSTSIVFTAYSVGEKATKGDFTFGFVLPQKLDRNDYLGYIVRLEVQLWEFVLIGHRSEIEQAILA